MTRADWVEIDFTFGRERFSLRLDLGRQKVQKSHGLCRGGPDVANLRPLKFITCQRAVQANFR